MRIFISKVVNWKLCRKKCSDIISGKPSTPQLSSGSAEEYSNTLDHDNKTLERGVKLRPSG
jgi:hypothetical protein